MNISPCKAKIYGHFWPAWPDEAEDVSEVVGYVVSLAIGRGIRPVPLKLASKTPREGKGLGAVVAETCGELSRKTSSRTRWMLSQRATKASSGRFSWAFLIGRNIAWAPGDLSPGCEMIFRLHAVQWHSDSVLCRGIPRLGDLGASGAHVGWQQRARNARSLTPH